jgi:potassium-transporting ATPase KdpC subunit
MSETDVRQLIARHTEGRQFGVLGEPSVHVLELNLDLDAVHPMSGQQTAPTQISSVSPR